MEIDRNTRLIAAPTIVVRHSGNVLELDAGGPVARATPEALPLLVAFWLPTSVGDALSSLRPLVRGPQAWAELAATIPVLARAGVLVAEQGETALVLEGPLPPTATDHPSLDYLEKLLHAVERGLPDGATVVDVAPHTGVAGLVAARAGARQVVLLSHHQDHGRYRALFSKAGLDHRLVTEQRCPTLPSEAPVVVIAERLGQEPLLQDWLRTIGKLGREPLSRAGLSTLGQITPHFQLGEVPPDELELFTERNLAEWQSRYGMRFGPLGAAHGSVSRISVPGRSGGKWRERSPRQALRSWDPRRDALEYVATQEVRVTAAGMVNAVRAATAIDFHARGVPSGGGYETRGWIDVLPPFEVESGDRIRVCLKAVPNATFVEVERI